MLARPRSFRPSEVDQPEPKMLLAPLDRRLLQWPILHDEVPLVDRVVCVSCVVKASDEVETFVSMTDQMCSE